MTQEVLPLPHPDSRELSTLISDSASRLLYCFLYDHRDNPPTMVEIRNHFAARTGESHSQTDRRVRGLRDVYGLVVLCKRMDGLHRYILTGIRPNNNDLRTSISPRVRARVLLNQRCAQCGKTPTEDAVKLEVDHKLPLTWGGDSDIDNLQALCRGCNHDKRDYFSSIDQYSDLIRAAASWLQPHKRIGEALKAFAAGGELAPSEILGVVACMHQFQDDWQKRLRELKELGWKYRVHYRYQSGRKRSHYDLIEWTPWPDGDIAAEIRRREKQRKALDKRASS